MITITQATEITAQQVADLMVTAFEGGSGYWCGVHGYTLNRPKTSDRVEPWYADPNTWSNPFIIVFYDIEDEAETWTLDNQKLAEGLKAYAQAYPEALARDFTEDGYEGDADDADTALQMILFGTLVYG